MSLKLDFSIIDYLFPPKCICCEKVLHMASKKIREKGGDALCSECRGIWESEKLKTCSYCGEAYMDCRCSPYALRKEGCHNLLKLCAYDRDPDSVQSKLVFSLKKRADRHSEIFLATQLSSVIKGFINDFSDYEFCITSIPRADENFLIYGYDHGEILARAVAEICGIAYLKLIERNGKRGEQKQLSGKERFENVKGAFSVTCDVRKVGGRAVIVVDDVVTTGATMSEALRALKSHGISEFAAAVLFTNDRKKGQ